MKPLTLKQKPKGLGMTVAIESDTGVKFFVPGKAEPGGSKRAFVPKGWTRPIITDANKNAAAWKSTVKMFAMQAWGKPPMTGPLRLDITFTVKRPQGHYGSGRNAGALKDWAAREKPTTKPDCTKLTRSTEDALTGILWVDDAQIVEQRITKRYGYEIGATIEVRPIETE